MIIRVEHRERYTVITNQALRDPRLSFRATGILAYVLSFTDDIDLSGRNLCEAKLEGRDAVLNALRELQTLGYLRRYKEQGPDGKWFTVCVLSELAPSPENPDSVPGNRTVTSHKPSPEKPNPVFQDSKDLSTELLSTEFAPSPWEPEGKLTAEQKLDGLANVAKVRERLGWDKPKPQ